MHLKESSALFLTIQLCLYHGSGDVVFLKVVTDFLFKQLHNLIQTQNVGLWTNHKLFIQSPGIINRFDSSQCNIILSNKNWCAKRRKYKKLEDINE